MNCLVFLSCLFAVYLAAASAQFLFPTSTGRPGLTTGRPGLTTGRPATSTAGSSLSCVCSCCSGLRCKPVALRTFADSTCTNKSCKEKCKVFEPTHCDHTFMGTNDAYCTVQV